MTSTHAVPTMQGAGLRDLLLSCLAVERWADDVVAGAPYESVDALLAAARTAATTLSEAEIDSALAHHPRIGERATGGGAAEAFSRAEQASVDADDGVVNHAIARGNAEYEQRFDRVFLIRAMGRTRSEILAELTRRLELDDATELAVVSSELTDITLLRLASSLGDAA